ncbi:DUF1566 domain-containing protein [Rheinheimera sp. 1928-s]|uniref:Lcl C-terminal domain-containing protein n=1 Tax=Rheinheimera sp. 1928-s TaxID=3033803 RepID=UPI00263496A3|nr:DUF1566 domain-containing protein [Rheinheimera sp. 1928-s]MDF3126167.1 DUF1566 domain-containing protein [Rheinheimera sp. 1928-s]
MSKYFCFMLMVALPVQAAQVCYSDISTTKPISSFQLNTDGTVLDTTTKLMWSRCLVGQSWDSSSRSCTGTAQQLDWSEALTESKRSALAGFSTWRLPNAKEVLTLIERSCVDPAINLTAFPASNSENMWTGTTVVNEPDRAWAIAMYSGKNNTKEKIVRLYVRLVRFSDE